MTTSNPSSFPRALIIRANGHIEVVANTGLACLQEAVGGYIEAVHLGRVAVMYVNEEGLLIGDIAPNLIATNIAQKFSPGICPDCYERVMAPQLRKLGVGPTLPKETEREERPGMPVGLRWRTGLR